jgi:hypothetical protein
LLALAVAAAPAGAITNGSPDGNGHPNVGGLVADTAFSDGTWIFWGITPAELPAAGSLSKLPGTQQFTSVGYGAYDVTSGAGGGHQYLYNDVRGVATGTLNTTTSAWLKISMNPSHGDGGTCYGDSGGPNFLGTSDVIAGTTITGDTQCRSTNVDYRLDTPSARSFLADYVALP